MTMAGAVRTPWLTILMLFGAAVQCQENPYVYVKMPLTVPWTLYFVFLGAVLIPFVVMIALAWRGPPRDDSGTPPAPRRDRAESGG